MARRGRTRRDPRPARPSSVRRPLTPRTSSPCSSNSPRRRRFRRRSPSINLASLADQATLLQAIVLAHAPPTHTLRTRFPVDAIARPRACADRGRFRASGAPSLRSASAPPCRSSATGSSPRVCRIIGRPPTSAASPRRRLAAGREGSFLFEGRLARPASFGAPRLQEEGIRPPARRSSNRFEAEKTWST